MSRSARNIINWAIALLFMFGFGFIPPLGGDITPLGMQVLGVFIGLLYGWCCLEFLPVSFMALLALGLTDYTTVLGAFGTGFSNSMALQILLLLLFAGYLSSSGLPTLITAWFLTRKVLKGRPYLLFGAIFICGGVLMGLGLSFGAIFLIWAVLYDLFGKLGYTKDDKLVPYLLFGVTVVAVIGYAVPNFQIFPITVIGILEQTLNMSTPIGSWWLYNILYLICYTIVYLIFGKYILKLDVSKFDGKDDLFDALKNQSITIQQRVAMGVTILFIALNLLPVMLPDHWSITAFLAEFGLVGAAAVVMGITTVIQIDGKPIADWEKDARTINWGLLSMFVAVAPISTALESNEAGIISTLVSIFGPMLNGLPVYAFYIATLVLFFVLTQFCHNLVLAMVLTPTLLVFCVQTGGNPVVLIAGINVACQMAYLTPGASSPAAMFHGNSEWVNVKDGYFFGATGSLLGLAVLLLTLPLADLIF